MTHKARFDTLRARWLACEAKHDAFRVSLQARYGYDRPLASIALTAGERRKEEALRAASRKVEEAFFTLLDTVSPRGWRSGVPWHWIMTSLTWDDATTGNALGVVPPPAYGSTPDDMRRFAGPVQSARRA